MLLVECPACGDLAGLERMAGSPDGWRMIDTSDETAIQVCGTHDGESDEDVLRQVVDHNGEDFLAGGEPPDSLVLRALRAAPEVLTYPVRAFAPVFGLPYAVVRGIAQGLVAQWQISSPRQ